MRIRRANLGPHKDSEAARLSIPEVNIKCQSQDDRRLTELGESWGQARGRAEGLYEVWIYRLWNLVTSQVTSF